ncbi:pentapeptide repeat-containing protein [Micromonospora sp. NPDC049114]|uniref:pentapeptide repeat-containing protein n=1 Tax=Micromonospora sp. NPDC049114 TaxID=3155498 RepID=UPI0033ECA087
MLSSFISWVQEIWNQGAASKFNVIALSAMSYILAVKLIKFTSNTIATLSARRRGQYRAAAQRRLLDYKPRHFLPTYLGVIALGGLGSWVTYNVILRVLQTSNRTQTLTPTAQLEVIKTSLTVVAGIGAGTGIYVAYRKQRAEEVNAVRGQDETYHERFSESTQKLNDPTDIVRSSSLSILIELATVWRSGRQRCVDVICQYLRQAVQQDLMSGLDHTAALHRVLESARGRYRSSGWDGSTLNLSGTPIPGANLTGVRLNEATFEGCTFTGTADFDQAIFYGRVSFRDAVFEEHASFINAIFLDECDFHGARFLGGASFYGAVFRERASFSEASFQVYRSPLLFCSTRFGRTTFFESADFTGTALHVGLSSAHSLAHLIFSEAVFIGDLGLDDASFKISWRPDQPEDSAPNGLEAKADWELGQIRRAVRSNFAWRRPDLVLVAAKRVTTAGPKVAAARATEHSLYG